MTTILKRAFKALLTRHLPAAGPVPLLHLPSALQSSCFYFLCTQDLCSSQGLSLKDSTFRASFSIERSHREVPFPSQPSPDSYCFC